MSGVANSARRCCRRMRERPSDSVVTNAAMTGGTAIRASSRANGLLPLSARFAGRASHLTNRQNTVPEHVSTHQDDHNHQRHVAAFLWLKSIVKRRIQCPNARWLYPNAGVYSQTQGGYIQTQEYIVKRKVAISKRKGIYPNARWLYPNAGVYSQTQEVNGQTQESPCV